MKTRGLIASLVAAVLALVAGLDQYEVIGVPDSLMEFVKYAGAFVVGLVLKSPIKDAAQPPELK